MSSKLQDSEEILRKLAGDTPILKRLLQVWIEEDTGVGWASLFIFIGAFGSLLYLPSSLAANRSWSWFELLGSMASPAITMIAVICYSTNRFKEQQDRQQVERLLRAYKLRFDQNDSADENSSDEENKSERVEILSHPIWKYLAEEYRWEPERGEVPSGKETSNGRAFSDPLAFPTKILKAKKVKTLDIADKFSDNRKAADFNCVISATPDSTYVKNQESWCKWSRYFAKYFRQPHQKRHLVSRVFSCPASFERGNSDILKVELDKRKWDDDSLCKQASWLLCYLLINECCGVDTRLHLYQTSGEERATTNDFFEFADYVLVHHYGNESDSSLYVAIPQNEHYSHRFKNRLLVAAFTREFYQRLAPGYDLSGGGDILIQVSPASLGCICRCLALDVDDIDQLIGKLPSLKSSDVSPDIITHLSEWLGMAKVALAAQ